MIQNCRKVTFGFLHQTHKIPVRQMFLDTVAVSGRLCPGRDPDGHYGTFTGIP